MSRRLRHLAFAFIVAVSAWAAGADEPCQVSLQAICSPLLDGRGVCYDDSTRWVQLTLTGDCRLDRDQAQWSIAPEGHAGQAEVFPWQPGTGIAYVRGECGIYRVAARLGRVAMGVEVDLPGPLCNDRQAYVPSSADAAAGLGAQCPGQSTAWLTVAHLRAAAMDLPDDARVAVLVDGKVARLVTVVAPGCWAGGLARAYGLEHCDAGQPADTLVLY